MEHIFCEPTNSCCCEQCVNFDIALMVMLSLKSGFLPPPMTTLVEKQPHLDCSMEEVKLANRSANESCNKVLNSLSESQGVQNQIQRNISMETGEAVGKFRRVTSLLSKTLGHARAKTLAK